MSSVVASFTFNPFQENTYLLYDESKECVIIDPGCYSEMERKELVNFIESNQLRPSRLVNTHCHIDHVLGNKFVADKYGLQLEIHQGELVVLNMLEQTAMLYGIPIEPSPHPGRFLKEGDKFEFGNSELDILFTPGHSPASISFFSAKDKYLIAGDVLFQGSIGRTDLPGGDFKTLLNSIKKEFFPLGDEVKVYPGHGPSTTIGLERRQNPFLQDIASYQD